MINAIALAMLFFALGLVMVLPPEPTLVMSSSDGESMLKLTKEVVEDTLSKTEEILIDTKDALTKGVEVVAKPIEKSMGWFRRKPKLEDQLKIVKEKFDYCKEAMKEATIELKDETLEKLNLATQSFKDKTTGISYEVNKTNHFIIYELLFDQFFNFIIIILIKKYNFTIRSYNK